MIVLQGSGIMFTLLIVYFNQESLIFRATLVMIRKTLHGRITVRCERLKLKVKGKD